MAALPATTPAPPAHARRAAAACLLAAIATLGLAAFARYVHDYILYRGFGPPVATVRPAAQGRVVTLAFRSAALGGRTERALVYLPAAYRTEPPRASRSSTCCTGRRATRAPPSSTRSTSRRASTSRSSAAGCAR